jgi:hypothetical protein
MLDPQLIVIVGNVRRAGAQGCTVEWLYRRLNMSRLAIEKALALQIQAGLMTEENGVYRMREGT